MTTPYGQQFYERQRTRSVNSAERVLPVVLDVCRPRSIVDVGCGVGGWLSVASAAGISDVVGVDGGYVDPSWLTIDPGSFLPRDLTSSIQLDRTFDLAMSLEVAEHLPAERGPSFVADLCRLAPLVLFSAAIPGQGGAEHINEQWPDYWVKLFASEGYELIDCLRERFWDDEGVAFYYSQNAMIYARAGTLPDQARGPRMPLRAVHPKLFEAAGAEPVVALRRWATDLLAQLARLPAALRVSYAARASRR